MAVRKRKNPFLSTPTPVTQALIHTLSQLKNTQGIQKGSLKLTAQYYKENAKLTKRRPSLNSQMELRVNSNKPDILLQENLIEQHDTIIM